MPGIYTVTEQAYDKYESQETHSVNEVCVNGIAMIPQYIWIKGTAICKELYLHPADGEL